ncbi:MAG: mechanosensitive ion channel [Muribaculaceae bacterium]|nr:mechanosensitive ion channel [Muribaculaceae bacterium]
MGLDDIIATVSNSVVNFAFKLILAIAVFYIGRFLVRKLYKGVSNLMNKRKIDTSLITFVLSLIKISLYFILIITVIGILGVETSSFIAIFASAGVAVGMALSGTLQNFAGGVLILLLKPYKVGDFIEVQGFSGTVKSIQLFNTVINTPDNKSIIIPNGALSTSSVNNYSLEDYRRVDWSIGLSYGTDFEAASKEILAILDSDSRVVKQYIEEDSSYKGGATTKVERKPFVGLGELGDSAIQIIVRAWTHKDNYWPLFFDLNKRFYTELPEKGFSFPFPQMDVHLDR